SWPRMYRHVLRVVAVCALAASAACGSHTDSSESRTAAGQAAVKPASKTTSRPKLVALGDSLTAGLGLPAEEAYPALLQRFIDADGLGYEVVNAGVSGDTSAGGLSRLDWALDGDVRVLLVALGGNDALRGLPVANLRQNL